MGKHRTYDCGPQCKVEHALGPLVGKWKGSIVFLIRDRSVRFNSLAAMLPGVSARILAKQLKEMEDDGLIVREVLSEKPMAVEYSLTKYGKELLPIISSLVEWRGKANMTVAEASVDRICGSNGYAATARPETSPSSLL